MYNSIAVLAFQCLVRWYRYSAVRVVTDWILKAGVWGRGVMRSTVPDGEFFSFWDFAALRVFVYSKVALLALVRVPGSKIPRASGAF